MSSTPVNEYELVYIVQPGLDDEALNTFNGRFTQTVVNNGGEIVSTEPWGRRTLAYPIKKHFEGHYVLQRFHMPTSGAAELDRFLRLNEDVIRYMLIRIDE
ncbi:MAG: 30S ribosomal protein S6 [Caldilineaceae bacterium]